MNASSRMDPTPGTQLR
uniref:Uncharacterized protein n=1 Tax=Arundo donax TaxID=35708 RepID=A0A0A9E317_ARUDO